VPAGNYALTARATDSKGVSSTSPVVNISVNDLPAVFIASPLHGTQLLIYLDGNLNAAKASTVSPGTGTNYLRIGQGVVDGNFFNGLIDEVRITAGVVDAGNFTPQAHLKVVAGTRALWNFDGQATNDIAANSSHGSVNGGLVFSTDTP
jgi:hypothetical protein